MPDNKKNIKKRIAAPKPPKQPYSLHDSYISGFKARKGRLYIFFEKGFYSLYDQNGNDHLVQGRLLVEGIDWDCATLTVQKFKGSSNLGKFGGKRYSLKKYSKKKKRADLEIVDTYFGYNSLFLSGFMYGKKKIREWQLELYWNGNLYYEIL